MKTLCEIRYLVFERAEVRDPLLERLHSHHLISQKVLKTSFCKSQLPHKFVNFSFTLVMTKDTLTDSHDLIRISIHENYSGSMKFLLHIWIAWVIVKEHLAQIGRIDGPTEYSSQILAAIRSLRMISFGRSQEIEQHRAEMNSSEFSATMHGTRSGRARPTARTHPHTYLSICMYISIHIYLSIYLYTYI